MSTTQQKFELTPAQEHNDYLLDAFAQLVYAGYDSSHDINHARQVARNALIIAEKELENYTSSETKNYDESETKLLLWLGYAHDGVDYKYKSISMPRTQFRQALIEQFNEETADNMLFLFDNISWSKRDKSKSMSGRWAWYQMIIQDADWLEAIGERGIQRCETYQGTLGNGKSAVVAHIHEKLLKVGGALNTETARKIPQYFLSHL